MSKHDWQSQSCNWYAVCDATKHRVAVASQAPASAVKGRKGKAAAAPATASKGRGGGKKPQAAEEIEQTEDEPAAAEGQAGEADEEQGMWLASCCALS